jgi:hypothetical protein
MRAYALAIACAVVLALVAAVAAGAAGQRYWSQRGNDYRCEGTGTGVICKSGGFEVGITRAFLYIRKQGNVNTAPTFGCEKWTSWRECFEG